MMKDAECSFTHPPDRKRPRLYRITDLDQTLERNHLFETQLCTEKAAINPPYAHRLKPESPFNALAHNSQSTAKFTAKSKTQDSEILVGTAV